jgi:hypothetical protein
MTDAQSPTDAGTGAQDPLSTLRGPSVGPVNVRRIGQILAALGVLSLIVLVVVFLVAGVHRNSQISDLHQHGVKTNMTVTGCLTQIGGTGSNPAGYRCQGTLSLNGHRYTEPIPGMTQYRRGQILPVIVVPNDPALLATQGSYAGQHTSASVFILPAVLFVVLVLLVGGLVLERRRHAAGSSPD